MYSGDLMSNNKENNHNKKKWLKMTAYIISAILVIFYLVVLWWGSHPDVGIEYRMYYITHELSDWPGYGRLSYKPGTEEICTGLKDRNGQDVTYTVCHRKGKGWQEEQYEGSVNDNTTSYIYYLPKTDGIIYDADYTAEIKNFTGEGYVKVYINDTYAGMFEGKGTYTFKTSAIENDRLVTIRFEADNCSFNLWSTKLG